MVCLLTLNLQPDNRVTVDMGCPEFAPAAVPFDSTGLAPRLERRCEFWPLALPGVDDVEIAVLSMGNPHAVMLVDDSEQAPVATLGPLIEHHARFPQRVNAGFLQILGRHEVKLRVYERGAGETLACGTGACAAVAAGIRAGWLDARVDVHTRGGLLTIEWAGAADEHAPVMLTGPAEFVFEGEITL